MFGHHNKEQCHSPSRCGVPWTACMDPKQDTNFTLTHQFNSMHPCEIRPNICKLNFLYPVFQK